MRGMPLETGAFRALLLIKDEDMSTMAILTCKNHPELRWSCKDIAISNGHYNGSRNIFFGGTPTGKGMYSDGSGLDTSTHIEQRDADGMVTGYRFYGECECPASDLVLAPEDKLVKRG